MISRRRFFFVVGAATVTPCGKKPPEADTRVCTDVTALSKMEASARRMTAYVDRSPDPERTCRDCQQYIEPESRDACGACKLVKGPVHPSGSCKLFIKRG